MDYEYLRCIGGVSDAVNWHNTNNTSKAMFEVLKPNYYEVERLLLYGDIEADGSIKITEKLPLNSSDAASYNLLIRLNGDVPANGKTYLKFEANKRPHVNSDIPTTYYNSVEAIRLLYNNKDIQPEMLRRCNVIHVVAEVVGYEKVGHVIGILPDSDSSAATYNFVPTDLKNSVSGVVEIPEFTFNVRCVPNSTADSVYSICDIWVGDESPIVTPVDFKIVWEPAPTIAQPNPIFPNTSYRPSLNWSVYTAAQAGGSVLDNSSLVLYKNIKAYRLAIYAGAWSEPYQVKVAVMNSSAMFHVLRGSSQIIHRQTVGAQ